VEGTALKINLTFTDKSSRDVRWTTITKLKPLPLSKE
jgi:hypothetical protein